MRRIGRVAIMTALLVPLVASPVAAQNYRWDLGVNGGGSWYSKVLSGEDLVQDFESAKFKPGWLVGSQLGIWFTPRVGIRANMAYADRPLMVTRENAEDIDAIEHVNLWSGSGDLLVRFREPNVDWMGTEFLPYVALGLGAKWINPAGDAFTCAETGTTENDSFTCQPFMPAPATGNTYALEEGSSFMGLVGLGADVRFRPNMALRLEINDRIYKPDLHVINPPASLIAGDVETKTVHEVGAQIGLHLLLGLARPQVVTVVPQPLPQPPPPPVYVPPTPPAPREEAVSVCVIDPTSTSGIRMQNAIFLPERGDTMVVVNGERVLLRNSVGNVMLARDADWYIRGQPLVMNVGTNRIEYLTYQGARQIEADRLSFLGTINGYPVYADRDEVADFIGPIQTLRTERPGQDLGVLLANRRDLRDRVEDVRYLYVPLEPTGCVFQTVQVMEQVRKGKDL